MNSIQDFKLSVLPIQSPFSRVLQVLLFGEWFV